MTKQANKDLVTDLKKSIAPDSMEDLKNKLRDMILNPESLETAPYKPKEDFYTTTPLILSTKPLTTTH